MELQSKWWGDRKTGKEKKLIRGLSIFDKLVKYANENEDASFFSVIKKGDEIHFCGSEEFVKRFKDNEPICDYTDSMIETRKESNLQGKM